MPIHALRIRSFAPALLVLAMALGLTAGSALAAPRTADPTGVWRSTSGNTFTIAATDGGRFDVVSTTPSGQRHLYPGVWVAGLEGTQLSYRVDGRDLIATFDRATGALQVRDGASPPSRWTRVGRGLPVSSVSGLWRSSTGNAFHILAATEGSSFPIIQTGTHGARTLYTGTWVSGLEGTQFTYGGYTATLDARSLTAIQLAGGTRASWTRVSPAPSRDEAFGFDSGAGSGADDVRVGIAGPRGPVRPLACRVGRATGRDAEIVVSLAGLSLVCTLDARALDYADGRR